MLEFIRDFRNLSHIALISFCSFLSILILVTLFGPKLSFLSEMKSFIVISGSMEPNIKTGSLIYAFPKSNYHKNDIIVFNQNGETITHRIVGQERIGGEIFFLTKGDANTLADEYLVNSSQILGATTISAPFLGEILMFFKSSIGFAAGIVLPAIIFIFIQGLSLLKIKNSG